MSINYGKFDKKEIDLIFTMFAFEYTENPEASNYKCKMNDKYYMKEYNDL